MIILGHIIKRGCTLAFYLMFHCKDTVPKQVTGSMQMSKQLNSTVYLDYNLECV